MWKRKGRKSENPKVDKKKTGKEVKFKENCWR